jgi:hypothetical protein
VALATELDRAEQAGNRKLVLGPCSTPRWRHKVTGLHWVAFALSTNQARAPSSPHRGLEHRQAQQHLVLSQEKDEAARKDGADSILSTGKRGNGTDLHYIPFFYFIDRGMGFSEQWETLFYFFFFFVLFFSLAAFLKGALVV